MKQFALVFIGGGLGSTLRYVFSKYLNTYENANIPVDGIYSWSDYQTVIKWQEKYPTEVLKPWNLKKGTGWVYISSLQKIRKVVEEGCLLG